MRQYRCKECVRAHHGSPEEKRRHYAGHLRRTYGITLEDYDAMLRAQNGCCAICEEPPKGKGRLVVDHCHDTEVVRGLLCITCNVALSVFNTEERLNAVRRYLKRGESNGG